MSLTKPHLKKIIKEELEKLLNEQKKCRTLRGATGILWNLLKANANHQALQHWRTLLNDPAACPSRQDVADAAEELMSVISKYWRQTAPRHLGYPEINTKKNCYNTQDEKACNNLKIVLNFEVKLRARTKNAKFAIKYIQNFLGDAETANIVKKYPVVPTR